MNTKFDCPVCGLMVVYYIVCSLFSHPGKVCYFRLNIVILFLHIVFLLLPLLYLHYCMSVCFGRAITPPVLSLRFPSILFIFCFCFFPISPPPPPLKNLENGLTTSYAVQIVKSSEAWLINIKLIRLDRFKRNRIRLDITEQNN